MNGNLRWLQVLSQDLKIYSHVLTLSHWNSDVNVVGFFVLD